MKRYEEISTHKQQQGISTIFQEIVKCIVEGTLDLETNNNDQEFIVYARQIARDTNDYESIYVQVGNRFYDTLLTMAITVAEDSYYTEEGRIIMEVFPHEIH